MSKKTNIEAPTIISYTETTCGEAVSMSLHGTPIHWRPDGKVNYRTPESDLAFILN